MYLYVSKELECCVSRRKWRWMGGGGAERADDGGDSGDPEGVRQAGGHQKAADDGVQG